MKRIHITIVLLLVALCPLFSQNGLTIKPYFMPQIILSGKDYTVSDFKPVPIKRQYVMRYAYGINLEIKIDKFTLGTGLSYTEKGQDYNMGFNEIYPSMSNRVYEIQTNYHKVPIYVKYNIIDLGKRFELDIIGGMYFSKLVQESDNYQNVIPEYIYLGRAGKWYNEKDNGIISGVGLNYKVNNRLFINADLIAEFGLIKTYSEDPWGYIWKLKDTKNRLIGLSLGLSYDIFSGANR